MKDQNKGLIDRRDQQEQYKWAIEKIYESDQHWKQDYDHVKVLLKKIKQLEGNLHSQDNLLRAMELYEEIMRLSLKVFAYGKMKRDEDNTLSQYQKLADQGQSLYIEAETSLSFLVPELLKLKEDQLEEFLLRNPKYQHFFDDILRGKAHVLTSKEENILARVGSIAQGPATIFSMFNNADIKFPIIENEKHEQVELTKGNYITLLESADRRVRKEAFSALHNSYEKMKNTLAAIYSTNLKKDYFYARVRNFSSSLEASLFNGNIPTTVYDQLIEAVHQKLPLLHRYVRLRKELLNLDELHMYDLYTPVVTGIDIKIPYEVAKETILKGLAPLGEEYVDLLRFGFENRWVDVYENKGKTGGAYSWGTYDSYPFVLMNYQGKVGDMFTLAHEMGHSLHSYYTARNQPFLYSQYKIFVAEVASTVNEALLMDYMIRNTEEPKEKMYYINQYLEQFRGTIFRQVMFAEFEKITHEKVASGQSLNAEELSKIYYDLNLAYFGQDMVVDDEIAIEWARIPHFYRNFYVYQYATGYGAAIALSKNILEKGEPAVAAYLEFLRAGDSDYPINVLQRVGADMTTSKPIIQALEVFEKLLDQLEQMG
ncbi:oligoendopeptidase F [Alkaliphilus crotonatoxidans]